MNRIIEDEGKWAGDACNSLGQPMSNRFAITTDGAQEQIEDQFRIIATDSLASNFPRLPVPTQHGLADGVYEWLGIDVIAPQC